MTVHKIAIMQGHTKYAVKLKIRCGGSVVSTRMLWSSHYLHDFSDFYSD